MARQRRQQPQRTRRRKPYTPLAAASASTIKPRGAFRVFSNYRLFAIIGAVVLFGGYAVSASSGGRVSAHGSGSSRSSGVRGEGVRGEAASPGDSASAPAPAKTVKQYAAPPPTAVSPSKHYLAVVETDQGAIQVELLPGEAPQAVNNFVFLARDGFYDGVTFHRVIPGFVAQAGDPTGTGIGGPGYDLPFEPSSRPFEAGTLAVARPSVAGLPNNGSQFFFTLGRNPTLDGRSTVIGRVVSGLDVLETLTPRDPQSTPDLPPGNVIRSIAIIES